MNRWLGVRIRLHPLFTLMMLVALLTGYWIETATLFVIVLVHEFGHIVVAKGFGWRVKEIRLLPFGGVAVMDESGGVPAGEECLVAIAGPMQHVWMIGAAFLLRGMGAGEPVWWDYVIHANVLIGAFNLLPVLPLDGGKILQALLSYAIPYHKALMFTVTVSLLSSVLITVGSMLTFFTGSVQLNLLAIGLFLLFSNWFDYRHLPFLFVRFLMSRSGRPSLQGDDPGLTEPIIVSSHRKIADVLKLFMREKYHLIYVLGDKGGISAVLPEKRVVDGYFGQTKPGGAISELIM